MSGLPVLRSTMPRGALMASARSQRRRGQRCLAAASIFTSAAVLVAQSGSTLTASAAPTVAKMYSLKVGIGAANASPANYWWALHTGIFQKLGLTVTTDIPASNILPTLIASGQIPISQSGSTTMFAATEAGVPQTIIYAQAAGNPASFLTVLANSPYHTLMDLSGHTVAALGTNGGGHGAAVAYSNYIVAHGGKALKILSADNSTANAGLLSSGQIAATVGTPVYGQQIAAGQFRQLLAGNAKLALKINGANDATQDWFGTTKSIKANAPAIVRLVAGLRVADLALKRTSNLQVAKIMQMDPNFAPSVTTLPSVQAGVTGSRPFWPKADGFLSKEVWNSSLTSFGNYGIILGSFDVNLHSPAFSYKAVVNMKYWNQATALIKKTKFTQAQTLGAKLP